MIFRDKVTGTLLNIRRDDFVNDRLYCHEIIRILGRKDGKPTGNTFSSDVRYSRPYHEVADLQAKNNNT